MAREVFAPRAGQIRLGSNFTVQPLAPGTLPLPSRLRGPSEGGEDSPQGGPAPPRPGPPTRLADPGWLKAMSRSKAPSPDRSRTPRRSAAQWLADGLATGPAASAAGAAPAVSDRAPAASGLATTPLAASGPTPSPLAASGPTTSAPPPAGPAASAAGAAPSAAAWAYWLPHLTAAGDLSNGLMMLAEGLYDSGHPLAPLAHDCFTTSQICTRVMRDVASRSPGVPPPVLAQEHTHNPLAERFRPGPTASAPVLSLPLPPP